MDVFVFALPHVASCRRLALPRFVGGPSYFAIFISSLVPSFASLSLSFSFMSQPPSSSQSSELSLYSRLHVQQELYNILVKRDQLDAVSDAASALAWAVDFTDALVRPYHTFSRPRLIFIVESFRRCSQIIRHG